MQLRKLEARVFGAALIIITAFFLWMVSGFLMPVFWAAVLAVIFRPSFLHFTQLLRGRRSTAALATTLMVVLVVLLPFTLLAIAVGQQAYSLYLRITMGEISIAAPLAFVERQLPAVARMLDRVNIDLDRVRVSLESAAVVVTQWIAAQALTIGQNALIMMVMFFLMLYFLFFFFRDGERIVQGLIRAIPMGDERETRLFMRFAEVSRATVKGTLIVAAVQGALGGLMFAIVGIHAALFWGVAMGILSLLPAVGAGLIWAPAAIIFFATGSIWKGVFLVVAGTLVVGLIDNLLRPILIGRQAHMPDYLVLLATLGGLAVFGLAGFVAGPIIASLVLVMWEVFADEYAPIVTPEPTAAPLPPAPAPAAPVVGEAE
jgi:predicted PurR-regulated permease PerM